ncbi:CDP-diacylglycerol--glycerol-3-phosphate 3-phosphatidyltransferase, partial [Pseudolycoriella hygida]
MFDPIADKLLVGCVIIMLVKKGVAGEIPCLLILAREFLVAGLREFLALIQEANQISLLDNNSNNQENMIKDYRLKNFGDKVPCSIVLCQENKIEEIDTTKLVDLFIDRFSQEDENISFEISKEKMSKYFLLLMMLIMVNDSFAHEQISNLITPVSYFVNHEKQRKALKDSLSQHRQASIVGTSGIGKTQLARTYAYDNKADYDISWFFDCNLDLNEEFVKLAKQLNSIKKTNISENVTLAKKEVISYLTHNNKWLLIFDNLKINENKKVQEFIEWEHNGNVIFCSQDSEKLPNTIEMTLFDKDTTIALANNLLDNKDKRDIEFLTTAFNGYPILIVQGAQLLNQIKGLNIEEYKEKIYRSADKITTNINMAIKELKPSAVKLLNKIALLNNQSFSKQLLSIITDSKDTIDGDICQLSEFLLISNIDPSEDNPVFEMHDIVANEIME